MPKKTNNTDIDLTSNENTSEQKLPLLGLGDAISKVTAALGIEECQGCQKRKDIANSIFPWLRASRDYKDDEVTFIRSLQSKNTMSNDEANRLFNLYNEIFPAPRRLDRCNCPGLILKIIERLAAFI
jgi:hypothetical protein